MNSGKSLTELLLLDPGTDWQHQSTALNIYRNYFASVARLVSVPRERLRCYLQLMRLLIEKTVKRLGRILRLSSQ
jgi:hypothetical protein